MMKIKDCFFQVVSVIVDEKHINNYIGEFTIDEGTLLITTLDNNIVYNMINVVKIILLLNVFDYERYVNKEIDMPDLHNLAKSRSFTENDVRLKDINGFKNYCTERKI